MVNFTGFIKDVPTAIMRKVRQIPTAGESQPPVCDPLSRAETKPVPPGPVVVGRERTAQRKQKQREPAVDSEELRRLAPEICGYLEAERQDKWRCGIALWQARKEVRRMRSKSESEHATEKAAFIPWLKQNGIVMAKQTLNDSLCLGRFHEHVMGTRLVPEKVLFARCKPTAVYRFGNAERPIAAWDEAVKMLRDGKTISERDGMALRKRHPCPSETKGAKSKASRSEQKRTEMLATLKMHLSTVTFPTEEMRGRVLHTLGNVITAVAAAESISVGTALCALVDDVIGPLAAASANKTPAADHADPYEDAIRSNTWPGGEIPQDIAFMKFGAPNQPSLLLGLEKSLLRTASSQVSKDYAYAFLKAIVRMPGGMDNCIERLFQEEHHTTRITGS